MYAHLSVFSVILVNTFRLFRNFCMVLTFTIAQSLLKIIFVYIIVHFHRQLKVFLYVMINRKNHFNCSLHPSKHNEINIHSWSLLKYAFCSIYGSKNIYYSFSGPHKKISLLNDTGKGGNCLRRNLIMLNYIIHNEIDTLLWFTANDFLYNMKWITFAGIHTRFRTLYSFALNITDDCWKRIFGYAKCS